MTILSLMPEWERENRLKVVLDEFNKNTSVGADRSVSFQDMDFQGTSSVLGDAFRYPRTLTSSEVNQLANRVMLDLRKCGPVEPVGFLAELNVRLASNLSLPINQFTMWTALRLRDLADSGGFALKFEDVSIAGRGVLPKGLHVEESTFVNGNVVPDELQHYGYLICKTTARNDDEAARKIFRASDAFMSLVNLTWREWNIFGGEHHAEAKLWEGPYQFMWQNDKFLGPAKFWFNINFDREEWDRHSKRGKDLKAILPYVRRGLRILEGHPLASVLLRAARLMHDGMAAREASYRLLRFWSALETLFLNDGESRSRVLIDRALFAETSPALARFKLEYLNKIRNQYVHSGEENESIYHLVQFLRDFTAQHILYLIYHGADFKSHDDYLAMCNLPGSIAALEAREEAIKRRRNIIRMRRHKPLRKR